MKAVEATIISRTIPRDPVPTLGKVIRPLKRTREPWLARPQEGAGGIDTVIGMMDLLWTGQEARHARGGKEAVKASPGVRGACGRLGAAGGARSARPGGARGSERPGTGLPLPEACHGTRRRENTEPNPR